MVFQMENGLGQTRMLEKTGESWSLAYCQPPLIVLASQSRAERKKKKKIEQSYFEIWFHKV